MSSTKEPTGSGSSANMHATQETADIRVPGATGKVEQDDAVAIGQIIDNRYRIMRKLGEGGMGEVYAAEHVHIDKKVAMKLLRSEVLSNKEAVARFYQEARSSSSIGHENIIAIEDFGTLPDGRIYLCMELLDGQPLNEMLESEIDPERILDILIQTCHGLAAAHVKNIVHRDMKPENIFVTHTPDGRDIPKLLDFGIAKVQGNDGDNNLTKTGMIFGTPFYMAPEQALGSGIDHRADVYAMGVIMYEIFTGTVPFQGESFMGILTKHITAEPDPPDVRAAQNGKQLIPGIAPIIVRAMKKAPVDRYQSMDELTNDLVGLRRQFIGAGMSAYMEPHVAAASLGMPAGGSGGYPAAGPASGPVAPLIQSGHPARSAPTPLPTPSARTSQEGMPAAGSSAAMSPYSGASASFSAAPSASSSSMYAMPKKGSKAGIIAAIFIILIVGGGIAGFVLMGGKKKTDKVAGQTTGQTTDQTTSGAATGTDGAATGNDGTAPGTDGTVTGNDGKDPGTDDGKDPGTDDGKDPGTDDGKDPGTDGKDPGNTTVITPEAKPVTVLVMSRPDRAVIYLDGKKLGKAPQNLQIVPGQPVKLTLKKRKYRDKTVTLDGTSERETIKLSRKPSSNSNSSGNSDTGNSDTGNSDTGNSGTGSLGLPLED